MFEVRSVREKIDAILELIPAVAITQTMYDNRCGLSIYFPSTFEEFLYDTYNKYDYYKLRFPKEALWYDILTETLQRECP